MELITSDANLMKCDPKKLMAEAVKAASIKLPLNKQLGYAYLVPYGTTPNMIIGYRGYIQLAMRTGQYRYINADVVYEGELSHKDKLTGAITLDGEKTSETVVGYFAHFELLNGCCKTLYMSIDEMANYALTYSGAWAKKPKDQKPSAEKLMERAQVQAQNGPEPGVGWWSNFNAMARKTVLRRLLSQYGYLSIEMMQALAHDEQPVYASAETIRDTENATAKPVFDANSMIQEPEEVKEEESEPSPI
jgi:recombination protein RecT